jgi:putative DNA primase/helicase
MDNRKEIMTGENYEPQTTENVKAAKEEIKKNVERIIREAEAIITKKPLYKYLPNDIEQSAAFGAYFGQYVKHNDAYGFLIYNFDDGKWLMGEVPKTGIVMLLEWLARQRWDFREISDDPDAKRYAKEIQGGRGIMRVFELLKYNADLKALPAEFDRHKHMILCKGKAVNLKTGEIRDALPEDFFTKSTNFAPMENLREAREACPVFTAFLRSVLCERLDLAEYLMSFLGLSLTGEMSEGVALFILGLTGNNGKSTLMNLLKMLLGDYIVEIPDSVIFKTNNEGRFDLWKVEKVRLALKSDIPAGVTINAGNFKNITGGDCSLQAEKKFHDIYSFTPECKIILCCNNKPHLPETGGAMERRISLLPFDADFKENPDKHLPEKLLAEAPAILALLIEYARRYYKNGCLPKSETVKEASREYMLDEDTIEQFIAERCKTEEKAFTPQDEMEKAIRDYVGKHLTRKTIKERLEAKGFKFKQTGKTGIAGKRGFSGIRLLTELEKT